ncbi:MAG: YIP1 family protein [Pseudomonadota bacterium]
MEAAADKEETGQTGRDAVFSLLIRPTAYLKQAVEELPSFVPLAVIFIAGFFQILSVLVLRAPSHGLSSFSLTAGLFMHLAGKAVILLGAAIVIHFFAATFNRTGSGWRLFSLFLVCQLPYIFLLPVSLLARAFPAGGWLVYYFFAALLTLWCIVLSVAAIKENYRISAARAALAFAFPLLLASVSWPLMLSHTVFKLLLHLAP